MPSLIRDYKNIIFAIFLLLAHTVHAEINLEANPQEFVLELKKIDIPHHPHAFNPSILRWKDKYLMSFREIPFPHLVNSSIYSSGNSQIGLIWLDDHFQPIGEAQILDFNAHSVYVHSSSEDARLITIGENLYIVYSDNTDLIISDGGFRMFVSKLSLENEHFVLCGTECLSQFDGENPKRREKNWVAFDYQGKMLLAYSLDPHRIFRPLLGTECCVTYNVSRPEICWKWGELRGGTPALPLDHSHYLSFFHSAIDMSTCHSHGQKILHYFMGAYTFSRNPPFEITQISPKPIIGKGFYTGETYEPYWKPVRVVFPCGFIYDGDYIWVAYGRQDHEVWLVKLDKQKLLGSLIDVRCSD